MMCFGVAQGLCVEARVPYLINIIAHELIVWGVGGARSRKPVRRGVRENALWSRACVRVRVCCAHRLPKGGLRPMQCTLLVPLHPSLAAPPPPRRRSRSSLASSQAVRA